MTRAEYMKDKIDYCTQQATTCQKRNDIEGVKFYQNAKTGFEKKLNGLTIEQCEEEDSKIFVRLSQLEKINDR